MPGPVSSTSRMRQASLVVGAHAHRDAAAGRRVAQRIVDQVAQQFAQHGRIALHHQRVARLLEAEVDARARTRSAPSPAPRCAPARDSSIGTKRAGLRRLVLGARQRQQLVDQAGGRLRTLGQLFQRTVDLVGAALAQRQFGLHAHAGQRRLHLVRGVGDEALLHLDALRQPLQHVVERADQRRYLFRHLAANRSATRSSGRRARMCCCSSASGYRPRDSANQTSASAIGRMMNSRQDHALDDFVGQLRALVQRFGHLHQRQPRLGVGRLGRRRRFT